MILSFPERGDGGDAAYRGNLSPKVYEWAIHHSRARSLIDPCIGGGTSLDVALRLGLDAQGSDLSTSPYHQRLKTRLEARGAAVHLGLDASGGEWAGHFREADLVMAHPAYGTQIAYHAGDGDLSACGDDEDFLERLQALALNMRSVTREGGHYVVVIGDTRKGGRYYSYQGELLSRLPRGELRSVTIKEQHNVSSSKQTYGHIGWDAITHEYVLVWRREGSMFVCFQAVQRQQREAAVRGWKNVVLHTMQRLKRAHLKEIYAAVLSDAPERVKANPHYQAKIRQVLQQLPEASSDGQGNWRWAA